jgi:hypothetical protein
MFGGLKEKVHFLDPPQVRFPDLGKLPANQLLEWTKKKKIQGSSFFGYYYVLKAFLFRSSLFSVPDLIASLCFCEKFGSVCQPTNTDFSPGPDFNSDLE